MLNTVRFASKKWLQRAAKAKHVEIRACFCRLSSVQQTLGLFEAVEQRAFLVFHEQIQFLKSLAHGGR